MLEKVKIREACPSHPGKGQTSVLRAQSVGLVTGWVSRDVVFLVFWGMTTHPCLGVRRETRNLSRASAALET